MRSSIRSVEILLVEDNPADIRLTQEVFMERASHNHISIARNGEEALQQLQSGLPSNNSARPDLIILDLNLPRKDGREVLREIKNDPTLRHIPVIVLTTSSNEKDILEAYNLHANCYILKPIDLNQFFGVVQQIERFWLETVHLPEGL